jgi:hypothetical protein
MVGLILLGSSLVGLVCEMQQVEACGHEFWFGYRCESYDLVALDYHG